ncbi:MAG: hypothetical protein IKL31_02255, partial [Ruminococcus sp.]|nr:hypothetical protein [Ruminococcus sp.]
MDIIKAAEDLRELEEAESFEEYIAENKEEICRILNEKSEELIEKGVKDINQAVIDYFIELLNEKAHGREDAYRTVYLLTDGGQGINYTDHLDIPEDSVVAKKLVKGIEIYEKVGEIKETVESAVEWYNDLNELSNLTDDNGKITAAGKTKLADMLDNFLGGVGGLIDKIPAAGIYGSVMSSLIDILKDTLPGVIKAGREKNQLTQLYDIASEYIESDYDLAEKIMYFAEEIDWSIAFSDHQYSNVLKCGPTYAETIRIIEENPDRVNDIMFLDAYLEWRYAYEYQEAIEKYEDYLWQLELLRRSRVNQGFLDSVFLEISQFMKENNIPLEGEQPKVEEEKNKFYQPRETKPYYYKGEVTTPPSISPPSTGTPGTGSFGFTIPYSPKKINTHDITPEGFYSFIEAKYAEDPEAASELFKDFMDAYKDERNRINEDDDFFTEMEKTMEELLEKYPDLGGEEYGGAKKVLPPRDPLIINFGSSDLNITDVENGAHFDLDKNGFAEKTAWVEKEDGFLAIDRNGNGIIDDGGELFSDYVIKKDGTKAIDGFDALKDFDDNLVKETGKIGDGIIDEKDSRFNELLVWIDEKNQGITDEGELHSLEYHNIKSISLDVKKPEIEPEDDNSEDNDEKKKLSENFFNAEVEYINGEKTKISEHWFDVKTNDTVEKDENGNNIIADSVESFGNVKNLSTAIEEDETGTLAQLVDNFKASNNYAEKRVLIKKILYFITDSTSIDAKSRGGNIDARDLHVIEQFMGDSFIGADGSSVPNSVAAPILKNVYYKIENMYFNLLNQETKVGSYLNMIHASVNSEGDRELDFSLFNYMIGLDMYYGLDID